MAGTVAGGRKAAQKNKAKDPDFYKKRALEAQESWKANGRKPRGFEYDKDLARRAGAKGGKISRRGAMSIAQVEALKQKQNEAQQVEEKKNPWLANLKRLVSNEAK